MESTLVSNLISSDKQNWMSAESESNLLSRVTELPTELDETKSYYKFIIKTTVSENERKINKTVVSCLKNCCFKVKHPPFHFNHSFLEVGCCCS